MGEQGRLTAQHHLHRSVRQGPVPAAARPGKGLQHGSHEVEGEILSEVHPTQRRRTGRPVEHLVQDPELGGQLLDGQDVQRLGRGQVAGGGGCLRDGLRDRLPRRTRADLPVEQQQREDQVGGLDGIDRCAGQRSQGRGEVRAALRGGRGQKVS